MKPSIIILLGVLILAAAILVSGVIPASSQPPGEIVFQNQPTATAGAQQPGSTPAAPTPTPTPAASNGKPVTNDEPNQGQAFLDEMQNFQPGDVQAGLNLVQNGSGPVPACKDCHGVNGEGSAVNGYPRLSGLQAFYIYHQLQAFQDGMRPNETMRGVAFELTPEMMRNAASYYAQVPVTKVETVQISQDAALRGQQVFEFGLRQGWDQWVPACYLCHGRQAQGVGETFPPLANQYAGYLQMQLQHFLGGERTSDVNGLMTSIAARLQTADMDAVAKYLNNLPPAPQPASTPTGQ